MKLLKIKTPSGYRMLIKNFEVNFLTKTRINKKADNSDLLELEPGLYYPLETAFIGKNSSGKTTVLILIYIILNFIKTGRIPLSYMDDRNHLEIDFVFYDDGYIYSYYGKFVRPSLDESPYLIIETECLRKTTYKPSYKKDLSNVSFEKANLIDSNNGTDTSGLAKFKFSSNSILINLISPNSANLATLIELTNELYGEGSFNSLVKLFDDSVELIEPVHLDDDSLAFKFKRVSQPEIMVDISYLRNRLSSGTLRGIYLFSSSLVAFRNGGDILVDEIEKSFNKNLIENLFILFNDSRINKKGATLIYSTHYSELLDSSTRCDNVNVLHRENDAISVKNISTDYEVRTDISKSNQFEQNAFDNLFSYDRLMDLRRMLLK